MTTLSMIAAFLKFIVELQIRWQYWREGKEDLRTDPIFKHHKFINLAWELDQGKDLFSQELGSLVQFSSKVGEFVLFSYLKSILPDLYYFTMHYKPLLFFAAPHPFFGKVDKLLTLATPSSAPCCDHASEMGQATPLLYPRQRNQFPQFKLNAWLLYFKFVYYLKEFVIVMCGWYCIVSTEQLETLYSSLSVRSHQKNRTFTSLTHPLIFLSLDPPPHLHGLHALICPPLSFIIELTLPPPNNLSE